MPDPKEIAVALETGIDGFFAAPRETKVEIIREWLDLNIGIESGAEIKSIPGIPMLEGVILEQISDIFITAIAKVIADKISGE